MQGNCTIEKKLDGILEKLEEECVSLPAGPRTRMRAGAGAASSGRIPSWFALPVLPSLAASGAAVVGAADAPHGVRTLADGVRRTSADGDAAGTATACCGDAAGAWGHGGADAHSAGPGTDGSGTSSDMVGPPGVPSPNGFAVASVASSSSAERLAGHAGADAGADAAPGAATPSLAADAADAGPCGCRVRGEAGSHTHHYGASGAGGAAAWRGLRPLAETLERAPGLGGKRYSSYALDVMAP